MLLLDFDSIKPSCYSWPCESGHYNYGNIHRSIRQGGWGWKRKLIWHSFSFFYRYFIILFISLRDYEQEKRGSKERFWKYYVVHKGQMETATKMDSRLRRMAKRPIIQLQRIVSALILREMPSIHIQRELLILQTTG